MNIKRYTARTAREALVLVREALGDDAVVLSTKPCADGVEVLAMAPEGMAQIQRLAESAPAAEPLSARPAGKSLAERSADRTDPPITPTHTSVVADDVAQLSMSTLSFQDYVRERMLRRRQAAQAARAEAASPAALAAPVTAAPVAAPPPPPQPPTRTSVLEQRMAERSPTPTPTPAPAITPPAHALRQAPRLRETLVPGTVLPVTEPVLAPASLGLTEAWPSPAPADRQDRRDQQDMLAELRSMKGLMEERFDALAYIERLQRQPGQARLTQKLLEGGFSPALIRKIAEGDRKSVV